MKYEINYDVYIKNTNKILKKDGIIKVKADNSLISQIMLEIYLTKKHKEPIKLVVHSCKEDINNPIDMFNGIFKDIFK